MRVVVGPDHSGGPGGELDDAALRELYAAPQLSWLRVNMVSSLDGAASGPSGLSRSLSNPIDRRVFDILRALCDVVVVGAGTARAEGYQPIATPLVLVSRRAQVPETLRGAEPGRVQLATVEEAEYLEEARALLGTEHVHVVGRTEVDLAELRRRLADRGLRHLLAEGGPHLLHDLVEQGVVDELDVTTIPTLLADDHPRIAAGGPLDVPLRLHLLLEEAGTLLGRWLV